MREKKLWLILTFPTTTAAMAMEHLCGESGFSGRLIPVPRAITAGCGMAWRTVPDQREAVCQAAEKAGIELSGVYEMLL